MKRPFLLKSFLLLFIFTCLIACDKEEPVDTSADVHFDGVNFSAPAFDPDTHTMAVFFDEDDLASFVDKNIEEVLVYIDEVPNQCNIIIFKNGINNQPGEELYNSNVSTELTADSWNFHTLSATVSISGEPIWAAVRVVQNNTIATVGCDAGPAAPNGDFILSESNNSWETLRERSENEVDINWNIRLRISE